MQERVLLPELVLTPGQKGQCGRRGRPVVLPGGRAGARPCFVSFSLYCPKDNIEEALLLLLISESMVSPRALLCPCGVGLWGRAVGSGTGCQVPVCSATREVPEAVILDLLLTQG